MPGYFLTPVDGRL